MTEETTRKPLVLGPDDLARPQGRPVDYEKLRELIIRHLEDHLPVLVEDAVTSAVEPIAKNLAEVLRTTVLERLTAERDSLVDDIVTELRGNRGD